MRNIAVEGIGTYIYEQIKDSYSEAKIQIYRSNRVSSRLGQTCALSILLGVLIYVENNTMERHAVLVLENQSVWKTTAIAGCVWTPLHIFVVVLERAAEDVAPSGMETSEPKQN